MYSQDMWNICQTIHSHWSSYHNLHLPGNGLVMADSAKVDPQLWWHVVSFEGIHMYMLYLRLVRPFQSIHKTCGIYGHPSMTTGTSYHNPHFLVDGFMVLQILPDLGPHIGRSLVWMEGIPVYKLNLRVVRPFPCTQRTYAMHVNTSTSTNPHIIPHPAPCWERLHDLQTLQILDSSLWWWMESFSMCKFHPRHIWYFQCLHKTCEIYGNSSMAIGTSFYIPHLPGDGWLVCRCYKILAHLPWIVYDVPWAPNIHTDVDTTLNSIMSGWIMLVYHDISNKARGSYTYQPYNTQWMHQK